MTPREKVIAAIDRYVSTIALVAILFGAVLLTVGFWHH